MPWYVALFWILSVALAPAAWRWGGWPERVVATTNLAGTIATRLAQPATAQFHHVEMPILLIDLAVFGIYLWVALKADRLWPMVATGLLAPSLLAHLARVVNPNFHADGYSIAGLTAYFILPVIALGIRNEARRKRDTLRP